MPHHSEYEKYAQECVTLARATQVPEHRVMLLHIADTWRRLADDAATKASKGNGAGVAVAEPMARRN
jgi:hypothetical protein